MSIGAHASGCKRATLNVKKDVVVKVGLCEETLGKVTKESHDI